MSVDALLLFLRAACNAELARAVAEGANLRDLVLCVDGDRLEARVARREDCPSLPPVSGERVPVVVRFRKHFALTAFELRSVGVA